MNPLPVRSWLRQLVMGLVLATMCAAPAAGKSAKPKVVADASYVQGLIEAPVPNYPAEAAQKSWSGIGVYEIRFRRDGIAERVNVVLTTGHRLLDDTARAALLRWRCKPGYKMK